MAGRGTARMRSDGKWELTVALGMEGKKQIRRYRTVQAKDKKEAERLLARFVTELESGLVGNARGIKLETFIGVWLKDYAEKNLAPKTLFRYKQLTARINKALGHVRLEKLRPNHLLSFYNNLQEPGIREDKEKERGLSERTILHYHRLLHTVLEAAVRWQYIVSNPAARVQPPKVSKQKAVCYDDEQVSAMLEALSKEPFMYQVVVWLSLSTGMRQGETFGLEWRHVDFETNTIRVEQAAQYLPGRGTFVKEPKNESSKRLIAVPASVMQMLKTYKTQQTGRRLQLGDKWNKSEMVFTQAFGQPMYPSTMSKWFPEFLSRHKLPHMNFHGLRHTCASLLIAEGATPTDLSKRLGHSTANTTLGIYAHSFKKADEKLADKMADILSNVTRKKA